MGVEAVWEHTPKASKPGGCKEQKETGTWLACSEKACGRRLSTVVQAPKPLRGPLSLTWAATVCDLVGKSFVTQAVLNPASERPNAARKPAPPAPTTTASNSWSTTGYCVEIWKEQFTCQPPIYLCHTLGRWVQWKSSDKMEEAMKEQPQQRGLPLCQDPECAAGTPHTDRTETQTRRRGSMHPSTWDTHHEVKC